MLLHTSYGKYDGDHERNALVWLARWLRKLWRMR